MQNRRVKIAFISQPLDRVLPPSQNSIGIWIYEVARRLAKDHEVHVYANGGIKPKPAVVKEGVHYHFIRALTFDQALDLSDRLPRNNDPYKPAYSSMLFSFEYAVSAALDIRRRGIEIVQTVNFSQYAPIVRALHPGVKFVLNMQCEWLSQLDQKMIAGRMQQIDLVLGCSEYITQKVRDRFPEHAGRCLTVFNGVDETTFAPRQPQLPAVDKGTPENPFRLLFVSRISPEKGVHVLLRAFKEVVKRQPNTELVLIGAPGAVPLDFLVKMTDDTLVADLAQFYQNGRYQDHLMREIPEELEPKVKFLGHVNRTAILEHFRVSDVLINPSLSEPFGMALVEGMAAGIPVIAPRVGGMVEIVQDGQTGYLVKPGDPGDLAGAILRLLETPTLRESMGRAGRERVLAAFSWDRIVESLLERYERLLPGINQPERENTSFNKI